MTFPSVSPGATLSDAELLHFSRHIAIPEIKLEGQQRLKSAKVVIVGIGGRGCSVASSLATAGVGHIGLVDFDIVEESNLNRQILYDTRCIGRKKVESAHARLSALNPYIHVEEHFTALTTDNALDVLRPYDIVVDGVDSFEARYLMNDACHILGKPNVHGSLSRFEGQASVFWPHKGPCYRCLYPQQSQSAVPPCDTDKTIFGPVAAMIGAIQALETLKILLDLGDPLVGRLMVCDALSMRLVQLSFDNDEQCPLCGSHADLSIDKLAALQPALKFPRTSPTNGAMTAEGVGGSQAPAA